MTKKMKDSVKANIKKRPWTKTWRAEINSTFQPTHSKKEYLKKESIKK